MREKIEGLRRCGSCSECCIALSVKEIEKPSMVRCESVCSAGCRVYESRPESCKSFECLWLMGAGSNADRPDRIGGVMGTPLRHSRPPQRRGSGVANDPVETVTSGAESSP